MLSANGRLEVYGEVGDVNCREDGRPDGSLMAYKVVLEDGRGCFVPHGIQGSFWVD